MERYCLLFSLCNAYVMTKIIKVPTQLINGVTSQNSLILDGCSVIEQCIQSVEEKGTMYLEDHILFFILEGSAVYHGMIFSIKDELIKSFLASSEKVIPKNTQGEVTTGVYPMNDCLITFADSLKPYFNGL